MKRQLLATALASLLAAALLVPAAQAYKTYTSINRFFQEDALNLGRASVLLNVVYRNRHRNGRFTPRQVYIQLQVPVSCQVGGNTAVTAASGPFKLDRGKLEFAYSYSSQAPDSFSYSVTGKKTRKGKKKQVDGTVTVFDYSSPPTFINCTSGGPLPFFATPCQWFLKKPSLPFCGHPFGPGPIEGDEGPIIIPENPPPPVSGS